MVHPAERGPSPRNGTSRLKDAIGRGARHRARLPRRHRIHQRGNARSSCARPPRRSAPASSTRARSSTSTASPTACRAFFREHDLPKRIRLGVASQKIALRVLELPVINNEQELEAAVRFQAQEELPMPLEQAVLDYRVLERIDNGEGGKMRVVVVGARRDTVEHLLAVARKAGPAARARRPVRVRDDPRAVRPAGTVARRRSRRPTARAAPRDRARRRAGGAARGEQPRPRRTAEAAEPARPSRRRSTATSVASPTLRSASGRAVSSTACCRTASSRWRRRSPSAAG